MTIPRCNPMKMLAAGMEPVMEPDGFSPTTDRKSEHTHREQQQTTRMCEILRQNRCICEILSRRLPYPTPGQKPDLKG